MSETNSAAHGGWFFPALALLFIALKLTGVIDWPWVWVLCPLWGPLAAVLLIALPVAVVLIFINRN